MAASASALLLATGAWALTPADACHLAKLRAARAHLVCRLGAHVEANKAGGTPDFTRCDARLANAWGRAEKKGQCPSSNDQAAIRAFLGLCSGAVATALSGGSLPACIVTPASVPSSPAPESAPSKCERLKLKSAADYSGCRLRAAGRALGSGDRGTDSCDARFAERWTRAERKRTPCPSSHDETEIRLFLTQCTDAVATALAGSALPTCSPPVADDEWPVFNRDQQNSRANTAEQAISPENVGELTVRWRIDGLAGVTSTPAVADGVVFFGDWSSVLHAVRALDGTEIWSRQVGSPVRASPLVAGSRVYAPESNGTLHAFDRATGDVVWAAPIDTQPFVSIDSSPILAGDTIVIGVESFEQVIQRPDYAFRGNIVGLDAETGAERWRVYTSENDATSGAGASVWSSAAVDEARKLVFIGTGQAYEQPAGPRTDALIAIRYDTGEVAWVHQFTTGDVFTVSGGGPGADADVGAAPNLFAIGSRDVVGVGQKNGFYHVLDRDTGEIVWEVELTPGSPLGGIMVTAAVHDGVIYVNSNRWRAFAFVTSGSHSPLDTSSTFALDARDGTILWETPMPAPMFGALTFANGVVYHPTIDGTVHALSAADGTELWSDQPGGDMAGGFSVSEGILYAGRGFWFFTQPPAPNGGLVAYGLPDHWVGTWSTSPVCYEAARILGLPASLKFDDQSVRMIVHTSIGGDTVRVRLTNHCGSTALDVGAAAIALRDTGARVQAATVRPLTFGGQPAVAIPPGSTATSDPVALDIPPSSDVAITLYLPAETLPTTSHPQAATGYASGSGDFTQAVDEASFPTVVRQWFFLDAVELQVGGEVGAIVAFGDSIIDGTGTTYDANRRWPDYLARRLAAAHEPFGVLNQGINGNRLLHSLLGDSALLRFDRDVLGQAGVRYVILLEGINDIGLGNPDVTADQVIAGYRELIDRAHAAGLRIFGGTLTPAEGNPFPFYEPYEESKRVAINQFIRESGEFDAVLDFAAAVSDPGDPSRWKPGLSADALHPTDAGAEVLAGAIDLSLFR